jgi:hypothetical protein
MDEKRSEQRTRRLRGGSIIFNGRHSTMDCQLRDISEHGARLKFVNTLGAPDEFQITFPGITENRWARRAWVKYDEMGIEFF